MLAARTAWRMMIFVSIGQLARRYSAAGECTTLGGGGL
jgi:hypothetical protein